MSRWSNLIQDSTLYQELQNFYQQKFLPIDVRYFLSAWFEEKEWDKLNPNNPQHLETGIGWLKELMGLMHNKIQALGGQSDLLLVKLRLESCLQDFGKKIEEAPKEFLQDIKECMEKENELFENWQGTAPENMDSDGQNEGDTLIPMERTNTEIIRDLQKFQAKVAELDASYRDMQHKQENFILQYQENIKLGNHQQSIHNSIEPLKQQIQNLPPGPNRDKYTQALKDAQNKENALLSEKKRVEAQLSQYGSQILQHRMELAESYKTLIEEVQVMQKRILDEELIGWKRRQQLGGNGTPPQPRELELLQQWCEYLAELIWGIRQQIKKMGILRAQLPIDLPYGVVDLLPTMNDTITGMVSSLVTSTFIVEQQPPQVLKKDSKFSATVRLLVGGKLNVQMNPPQVKCTIISEQQARGLLRGDINAKENCSGNILNNTGPMELTQAQGSASPCLSVHFRSLQLKMIKRSDKKGTEAVTEEKFCILFQSEFNVGGNDLVFQVWTVSLPVVVTVHGNQECNAMATVLWDNAFSDPGRVPFAVPDSVPWPKLGEQLHNKFLQFTSRGLNQDSLDYLASKIFNHTGVQDYSHQMVSWSQFNKETLKDRSFTFWEWFYAVLKLTKEHMKGPWDEGSIIGFISKTNAQDCLNRCENGTFLLRFSDSEAGGVTIAWIAESTAQPKEREVWNLAPYSGKDFCIRPLADRINDLKNLTYLYPNTPKDEAFKKYYSKEPETDQPTKNGYVPAQLVQVIGAQNMAPMDNASVGPSSPPHIPPSPIAPSPAVNSSPPHNASFNPDILDMMELTNMTQYLTTDYDLNDINDHGSIDVTPFLQPNYTSSPYSNMPQ